MERDQWGSDVPVSAPIPRDDLVGLPFVDLGGMAFIATGPVLPISSALHEQRYAPDWSPQIPKSQRAEN